MTVTALTEYERQRLENIKKNQSLLSSLAIKSIGPSSSKKKKNTTGSQELASSKKRSRPSSSSDSAVPPKRHATRSSVRLNGTTLLNLEEIQSPFLENSQLSERERDLRNKNRHADRKIVVETWRIPGTKESDTAPNSSSLLTDQLFKSISSGPNNEADQEIGSRRSLRNKVKREQVDLEYSPGNDDDYDRLSEQLNNLKLKSVTKVSQARIYSMAFHQDPTKSLLFVGDKSGGVGICDTLAVHQVKSEDDEKENVNQEEEEEEPEFLEGTSCFIQAHSRHSPISAIQTHPTQPHLIYTSSYDQSIRELNFETKDSIDVLNGNQINPDGETCFSNFEFINSGREIWASDNKGGLSHRDLRVSKQQSSTRWVISKKKIGCLSICPSSDDRLAVTSGLNREMRLWDLRALSAQSTESDISKMEETSCIAKYEHKLACSSAFFDPSGTKIISTSYDDHLRIWHFDPTTRFSWLNDLQKHQEQLANFTPTFSARHDNQTGRWVSVFKARWCLNPRFPSHFTIGNMNHKLDVYNAKGELLTQLKHNALSTVPAVTAQHPTSLSLQIAGATAGGKVYLWL